MKQWLQEQSNDYNSMMEKVMPPRSIFSQTVIHLKTTKRNAWVWKGSEIQHLCMFLKNKNILRRKNKSTSQNK